MRYMGLAVVLSLSLTGCAGLTGGAPPVDRVSFDRGAFALGYADLIGPLLKACGTTPGTPDCAKLAVLDAQVRQAIVDAPKTAAAAPSGLDLTTLLPIIMKLAGTGAIVP